MSSASASRLEVKTPNAASVNESIPVIVPVASLLELAVLGSQILLGGHLSSDLILFRQVRKISVRSEPGIWFNVDGELIGNSPARFEVVPRALKLIVG